MGLIKKYNGSSWIGVPVKAYNGSTHVNKIVKKYDGSAWENITAIKDHPTLPTGLMSYYKLDETSGTTAYDSVGSNNGTVSGATVNQTGKLNKCYSFDGNNDSVSITHTSAMLFTTFSVSFWMKRGSWSVDFARIIDKNYSTGFAICRYWNTTKLYLLVNGSDLQSSSTITQDVWTHVVCTRSGGTYKIYINGNLDNSRTGGNANQLTSTNTLAFGINKSTSVDAEDYNGALDEVGIWTKELTSTEVTYLYNLGKGIYYN